LETSIKNRKQIEGSILLEVLIALSISGLAILAILSQQMRSVQLFHNAIESEILSIMLTNVADAHYVGHDIQSISYDQQMFSVSISSALITLSSEQFLQKKHITAPISIKLKAGE
jgi:Tfp pilus assembly protein PilV